MSTNFGNNEGVIFGQLGLTSTLNGITLTQTLFDSITGQTTSISYSPPALNYILGAAMTQTITNPSYTGITSGILSLTTAASRAVEITLLAGATSSDGGFIVGIPQATISTNQFTLRVLRGPSTILGTMPFSVVSGLSPALATFRVPTTSFRWFDFSPPTGAATYILEAQVDIGLSFLIQINTTQMFVRQI